MDLTSMIAGIDEAGRGPLAGPVVAAAVVLNPAKPISGLTDSKLLSSHQRQALYDEITATAIAWAFAPASVAEIDQLNILQATLLAMQRAVRALNCRPAEAWIDGTICPALPCKTKAYVKGDQTVPVISAASIIAKVARDRIMRKLEQQYPGYDFAQHKGYGTKGHLHALNTLGPCPEHRQSFAPVKRAQLSCAS